MTRKGGRKKKDDSGSSGDLNQSSSSDSQPATPRSQQMPQPQQRSASTPVPSGVPQAGTSFHQQPQLQGAGRGRGRGRGFDKNQDKKVGKGMESSQQARDFPALQKSEPQKSVAWGPKAQQSQPHEQQQLQRQQQQQSQQPQQKQVPQYQQQQQPQHQKQQQQQQQQPYKAPDVEQTSQQLSQLSMKDEPKSVSPKKEVPILTVHRNDANKMLEKIPKRKDPNNAGTLGKRINVLTNMMEIKFGAKFPETVIHYDVDITPNVPKYLQRPAFEAARTKLFPKRYPAFDGKKNAFSAGFLSDKNPISTNVTVYNEDGREKDFEVTFKVANELDLSWLKSVQPGLRETERNQISLQALDVILRNAPATRAITVGRSFFTPPKGHIHSLGGGMDLWVGLFQSAVLGWKPFLNVDVSHKGFPKSQPVLDLIKTLCGCDDENEGGGQQSFGGRGGGRGGRGGRPQYGGRGGYDQGPRELTAELIERNKEEINKFLKNLKVTIEIPGQATSRRTQRVIGLVKCPRENTFDHNNHKISVEQYYKLEKKYVIKYPFFPCLWVGNREKNVHVPLEICTIVENQAVQKKLDEKQTSTMIRYAATGTEERKKKIMDTFNSMYYQKDNSIREFDVSLSGEFEKIPARVLAPPQLEYSEKRSARVMKGVWRPEKFLRASMELASENSWTILNLNNRTRDEELYDLQNALQKTGRELGMIINNPATPFEHIPIRGNYIRDLASYFDLQKKKNRKLVIVIVPDMKGPYSKVKQASELNVGVLTSCLKSKTLYKVRDQSTMSNILLKINTKLNGVNHNFDPRNSQPNCLKVPCIIVGADVTHPSPDATDIPSIAAVAASHDPNAFQYNIEIRLQPPRQEIIGELKEIMIIQLKFFYEKTQQKPSRIIFYRDGVSEGQFGQIMHAELTAIRAACTALNPNYKPKITFLVVQKRHHIRLFPTDRSNSDDAHKGFNVQAGTIVDTHITHPSDIDFYLVSHASIQGTARPTKYRCIWDDADMSENEIEQLTYFLCHMFCRCTRSVSYPTPTYYAHLAAFRARNLTQDVNIDITRLEQEQSRKLTIRPNVLKGTPMFFV